MSEEETKTTVIKPDTSSYESTRSASGSRSMHNGDPVARGLNGATLDETYSVVAEALETTTAELQERYGHLNVGQQRMNLGNRLRGVVNKLNKDTEGSGDSYVAELCAGIQEAVTKRQAAAAKEREAKEKAAAEAKAAKEKAAAEPKPKAKPKAKATPKKKAA